MSNSTTVYVKVKITDDWESRFDLTYADGVSVHMPMTMESLRPDRYQFIAEFLSDRYRLPAELFERLLLDEVHRVAAAQQNPDLDVTVAKSLEERVTSMFLGKNAPKPEPHVWRATHKVLIGDLEIPIATCPCGSTRVVAE